MRIRYVLITIVVAIAIAAVIRTSAQVVQVVPVAPHVVSGTDIGFRIEGLRGNTPVGKLVVKVDDRWVEVDFGSASRPASTR